MLMNKSGKANIVANDISFDVGNGVFIIKDLSLSLSNEKSGLVGLNGIGKTTLLRLLVGELEPTQGEILKNSNIAYLPQDYLLDPNQTIAEALGIKDKLEALAKVKAKEGGSKTLESIAQDWGIENRVLKNFEKLNFKNPDFSRRLDTLSGGEKMKVIIVKLLISKPDFIILDEPTNNLDLASRQTIYQLVRDWNKGLLVVSHDRNLLNLLSQILELTPKGLKLYGGNYDSYKTQKTLKEEAQGRHLVSATEDLQKIRQQAQKTKEKQEKRSATGKKSREKGGQPKMV